MEIVKKYLTNGQYLTSEDEKLGIGLHHTAGLTAAGALRWWDATPERVGTPYIIDRDGTIIECFDPKYWAFHLGIVGDDNWHEKHLIPIELVAAGWLTKELVGNEKREEFRFYPLYPDKTRYTVIPSTDVVVLGNKFQGYNYYHRYTEEQIESLVFLIKDLKVRFPKLVLNNDLTKFYEYNEEVVKNHTPGIWGHSTLNKHSTDVYPDENLIKALKNMQKELYPSKPQTVETPNPKKH